MLDVIRKYCSKEWVKFVTFHSETKKFKANEAIFEIGEKAEGIFFITTGKVKVSTKVANGKTRIIRLASDGSIFGHRGFGGSWEYAINTHTLVPTEVIFIPVEIFNETVKTNPEFGFFMMMFFAEELRESEQLARVLPVKNLVASALYANYKAFGFENETSTKLSFTLSRKDIANKAGTTYESAIRSLSELSNQGVIGIEGKAIHILDLQKLGDMELHSNSEKM